MTTYAVRMAREAGTFGLDSMAPETLRDLFLERAARKAQEQGN